MAQKKKSPLKKIVLGGGAVLLLGLLIFALRPKAQGADFATVERGALQVTLDEEGETRVRDRFTVSAPLAGRVLRIELEPGDPVLADDTVLAVFQPSAPTLLDSRSRAEAQAQLKAAEAALGLARAERDKVAAELRYAASELARYRKLAAAEIVSQDALESTELRESTASEALKSAEFAIRSRQHDLEMARARLVESSGAPSQNTGAPIELRSPIDGVVLRRLHESESVVPAGEPLIEVADPARLEIVADFLSTDAVRITAGQTVLIEQWGGNLALAGRVRRVEPSGFTKISALGVEEQRVNVIIDFADSREAWEALGDGFRVEVRVVIWEKEAILKAPTSSLFRHGESWAVFAVENGKAVLREIEIGQRNGLEAELLSGLEEGARVIVHPGDNIADGVAVTERSV